MAGDWLKIEVCTPDKPEVIGISDLLGICPAHAFGCLFLVWRWFDQHTTTGNALYVTKVTIDRLSGNGGFADAMVKVGWLAVNEDGSVSLPHFDTHNGETAKQRGLTAKRVAKSKAKSNAIGNGEVTVDALPREEKRREENKEQNPLASDDAGTSVVYSKSFLTFWDMYPNKKNKGAAFKAFKKIKPAEYQTVKTGLVAKMECADWLKDNGQYIPHPASWLNARGWEDETPTHANKAFDVNEFTKGLQ